MVFGIQPFSPRRLVGFDESTLGDKETGARSASIWMDMMGRFGRIVRSSNFNCSQQGVRNENALLILASELNAGGTASRWQMPRVRTKQAEDLQQQQHVHNETLGTAAGSTPIRRTRPIRRR